MNNNYVNTYTQHSTEVIDIYDKLKNIYNLFINNWHKFVLINLYEIENLLIKLYIFSIHKFWGETILKGYSLKPLSSQASIIYNDYNLVIDILAPKFINIWHNTFIYEKHNSNSASMVMRK